MEQLSLYHPQHEKIRLGKNNDGGYVICALPGAYDCFISGGVSDDITFDRALLDRYPGLPCYAFDGTIEGLPEKDDRITFVKKNLGEHNSDSTANLQSYLEPYSNVFMKIDIEGNEFRLLPGLVGQYLKKVKQLIVEIHSPGYFQLHPVWFAEFSDVKHEFMFDLLNSINRTHTLVHLHANNACQTHTFNEILLPNVFECTYIRNDFAGVKVKNTFSLPTTYDMPNDPAQPDISLSGFPFSF